MNSNIRKIANTSFIKYLLKIRTHTLFLIISGLMGVGYIVATPPFQGWDETEHFYRAYQISQFDMRADRVFAADASGFYESREIGHGGELPNNVTDTVRNLRFNENEKGVYDFSDVFKPENSSTDYSKSAPVRFDNTAIYSPIGYLPQSIGLSIVRFFDLSPVIGLYIARLAGFVAWLALTFYAIKFLPYGKRILLVLALNPVLIFLATTLSPDALAAGLISMLVALVFNLKSNNEKKVRHRWLIPVYLSCLALAIVMIKNVYLPIVLIILLIPKVFFPNKYKYITMLLIVISSLLWNFSIANMTSTIPSYFNIQGYIDTGDQISFILHNPIKFIAIIIWNILGTNSIIFNADYYGIFVANSLPDWTGYVWLGALAYAIATSRNLASAKKNIFINRDMVLIIITLIAIVGLIIISLYIGWSAVGDKDIAGVQGRYFIPLSFLLIPLLCNNKLNIIKPTVGIDMAVFSLMILALTATLGSLIVRYGIGV